MSNRTITDQQFSDKTTIDSDRLDDVNDSIEERMNNIPRGDIKNRYLEHTYHSSWLVCSGAQASSGFSGSDLKPYQYPYHGSGIGGENMMPWLRAANVVTDTVDDKGTPQNVFRIKGISNPIMSSPGGDDERNFNIDQTSPGPGILESTQLCWTQAHQVGADGAILDSISYVMTYNQLAFNLSGSQIPSAYGDEFRYNSFAAAGLIDTDNYAAGKFFKDMHVVVEVDSPISPEQRQEGSKVVARHLFKADSEAFSFRATLESADLSSISAGMIPAISFPAVKAANNTNGIRAIHINLENLNIPLPSGARVRWSLVIPQYGFASIPFGALVEPWGLDPMAKYDWASTLTLLEEIEE